MTRLRKNLSGEAMFHSFIPYSLAETEISNNNDMLQLIKDTQVSFNELNNVTASVTKEALEKIQEKEAESSFQLAEGKSFSTKGFGGISLFKSNEDQKDIDNIVRATKYGVETMDTLPLSSRLIKNIHYIVCQSERYEKKYPGEFRNSAVWIGKKDSTLKDALFVPPVNEDMTDAFSELEKFINYDESYHPLVAASLIHYQFEAIHPFIDANGRTGRILNTLYLMEKGLLASPALLLSTVLNEYDIRYPAELQKVNESGNFNRWAMFFISRLNDAAQLSVSQLLKTA